MEDNASSTSYVDDIADFTLGSINKPALYCEDADIANNAPTKVGTANTRRPNHLTKTKSTSSFIIPPHRKSSIIIASTGKKVERSYSTWNQLSDETQPSAANFPHESNNIPVLYSEISSIYSYLVSLLTKPIFKSSIAYFLASLAVYSSTVSDLLGSSDSKHIVCTVLVYFHPSRSIGSMIQALSFVSLSLLFGIGVSVTTLLSISTYLKTLTAPLTILTSSTVTDITSPYIIAYTLIICSTSLGLISFCKHRVRKQTFNTACSLAAILMISCLIKEYSKILDSDSSAHPIIPWDKIRSSILCVICGCLVSVLVCFTLWVNWAKKKLINQISVVKNLIAEVLALLCDIFTSDNWSLEVIELDRKRTSEAFKNLKTELSKLDAHLEETMYECFLTGREKEFLLYKELVQSEKKLVAYLGGLRRAVEFKLEMIEYYEKLRNNNRTSSEQFVDNSEELEISLSDTAIMNSDSESLNSSNSSSSNINSPDPDLKVITNLVEKPEELIEMFLYHLGPSMKSFVFTLNEILKGNMFDSRGNINEVVRQYSRSLNLARDLFELHQKKSIDSLYVQEIFSKNWNVDEKINQEEVAATCANFSFSITQLSNELENFLIIFNSLFDYNESPKRSFKFLKFWDKDKISINDVERNKLLSVDLEQSEEETIGYKFWKIIKFTRGVDFQFGFRVGLGALLLGMLAFLDSTRHIFIEWRGEWVLVTYCIIMNKSLGGTTMTLKWRFLGTFIGAFTAYSVWELFFPNVFLMAVSGFFVSIPCFNIILNWKANNAFGRFILLTYNLTVLYSYSMSRNAPPDGDDWEGGDSPVILEIAFHRYVGVSLGVVWAIVITLTLFPVSARSRVKRGLSVLWLRMGIIWKRGALHKRRDEYGQFRLDGLRGLKECHMIMDELRILLKQAPMEVRLKGPFPIDTYTKLINGTEGIIDAYENINSIVDIDPLLSPIETIVLENLRSELKELQNRVFLIFYMLASAMKLGLPLASDPATTEHAMAKLMSKLGDIRRTVEMRKELGKTAGLKNTDFVLFYTYCLVTNSIVNELSKLMTEVVNLYGKLDEETLELT